MGLARGLFELQGSLALLHTTHGGDAGPGLGQTTDFYMSDSSDVPQKSR